MATIAELDRQFGIPGIAHVVEGSGGLPTVQVTTSVAKGEMYLHGAHVTSFIPAGAQDALFLSAHSLWGDGHAIRGGVPICFPWFGNKAGDPHAPDHGFVRTKSWQLQSIERAGDAVAVTMFTASDDSTKKWWPADFRLVHRATFGSELILELIMTNIGAAPLRFEEAMHSYHNVGDVSLARVSGLDGVHYLDKTDSYRDKTQQGDVVIEAETDRVYLNTAHPLEVRDSVLRRRLGVVKDNSRTTVIWNPGSLKGPAMSDLGGDQWKRMLCIETSNVGDFAIELAPGQQHTLKATVGLTVL